MPSAPVIWVICEAQWTRALLRAELLERGFDAVGFLTVDDALDHLVTRRPEAVVLEYVAQPRGQLERLVKIGVPVVATGGRPAIEDASLAELPLAAVLARPVTLGAIASEVEARVPPMRE